MFDLHIILYVCSTNLALKMTLTKKNNEIVDEMVFKDYFNSLESDDHRNRIRDLFVITYGMGYTTFYRKIRNNSWTPLEFEKLEQITNQKFLRDGII